MRTLAHATTAAEPALLARITPFEPGSLENRLIYPADAPAGTLEKIQRFLLTPLMRLEARHQVMRFLGSERIQGLASAKALSNVLRKNPFRTVSARELSAVLAEAALTNIPLSRRFEPLTQAFFDDPNNLEAASRPLLHHASQPQQRAFQAIISFARDSTAPLNRRDAHPVRQLLANMDSFQLPAALSVPLTKIATQYLAAQEAAVGSGKGFCDGGTATSAAFDELHACLPAAEQPCIDAFERFAASGLLAGDERSSLQRMLPLFAQHVARLSRDAITDLLPHVIAAEDALAGKQRVASLRLSDQLTPDEHALAFALLHRMQEGASQYPATAALALIEYITLKRQVSGPPHRLINAESRIRLAYVASYPDRLMQCLPSAGKQVRKTAQRVLQELAEDLKKLNVPGGRQHEPGATTGLSGTN